MPFPPFADIAWGVNGLLRQPGARPHFLLQCFQYLKERAANPGPGCGLPIDRRPYSLATKYALLAALHTAFCETEIPINPAPWRVLWEPFRGLYPRTPAFRHVGMWGHLLTAAGAPDAHGVYRLECCQLRAADRQALESFLADVTEDLRRHLSDSQRDKPPAVLVAALATSPPPALGPATAASPSLEATTPAYHGSQQPVANRFQIDGSVWRVHFEENGETGTFTDRSDSVLRHLARLLAQPNRRFTIEEFYPPPAGAAPVPRYGRDESSDNLALKEYQKELNDLAQEIKEADEAHDTETAAQLRERFTALTDHLATEKRTRRRGHTKKCGTPSPGEKADQALRVGLERQKKRFRRKRLPALADHLDKYIDNTDFAWWYAPPPGTSPWHVVRPDPSTKINGNSEPGSH